MEERELLTQGRFALALRSLIAAVYSGEENAGEGSKE